MGWLLTHAHLLRRLAFFVAVVAVLDRGKVDEGIRLDWSPDRIHISPLRVPFRRIYSIDTNKDTNMYLSVGVIDGSKRYK